MKTELLEKYIFDARANRTSDEQIKQELTVGGWDPAAIDAALKNSATNIPKAQARVDAGLEFQQPVFFEGFLSIFIILLVAFNLVTYWGVISQNPTAAPVTNTDLIGGLIVSFILAAILSGIYTAIRKLIRKFRK